MFEKFKLVKVENEEVEAYHDDCSMCGNEMLARKSEIDKIKKGFPIIFAKLASVTYCSVCFEEMQKKDPNISLFSEEDIEDMKKGTSDKDLEKILS